MLLYLSKATWTRRIITGWGVARRAAARFVAGDTLEEALDVARGLNARGLFVTLDHLGEDVTNAEEAAAAAQEYLAILDRLAASGVRSNVSLKLTQLGLRVAQELALDHMRQIARKAAEYKMLVRIDMEDSPTIDATLAVYRTLRGEGLQNVGLVIQSYLYRSEEDTRSLLEQGARIRLVKGAYNEPPDLAYPRKADVDANYDRLARLIIEHALQAGAEPASADGRFPPVAAMATHDEARIAAAKACGKELGLPRQALEFQMLYGIRADLQEALAAEGYPVRVYVPFGTEWYAYYMRRLAERPANLWFFLSNLLRR